MPKNCRAVVQTDLASTLAIVTPARLPDDALLGAGITADILRGRPKCYRMLSECAIPTTLTCCQAFLGVNEDQLLHKNQSQQIAPADGKCTNTIESGKCIHTR